MPKTEIGKKGQKLVEIKNWEKWLQISSILSSSRFRSGPGQCPCQCSTLKQTQNLSFRVKSMDLERHYNQMSPPTATHPLNFSKGCLQKKNSIWRYIVPTSHYPLTPFKIRDKHRRDIFWALDPPPPLQK